MSASLEENTKALHESTHTAGAVEAEMWDARTDIRELTREIVRSGK
jgi:hypothetical protein